MNGETNSLTRILFVDDSKVMVKTASKILSVEFDVITAVDGDDAWEKLGRHHDIQVLFTDINMPNCDGYGLLKKVRTADDPGLRNMPVILVTGADDDASARQQALDGGATDFINKKSASSELLPRARAHAKYQRISKQLQAQSTLDPLTGLANEQGFLGRLEQDIAYAHRHGQELTLMRVEIEGLVGIFQDRGNEVVEHIVVHVSHLIRKRIREEDTAGHIGLGGFAISLPGGHLEGIEAMAARLHADVAATSLAIPGQRIPIRLRTAIVSTKEGAWASTVDALDRCEDALDRASQPAPVQPVPAKVAQPQPARSDAKPVVAATKAPERETATTTPSHESTRPEPLRETPKQIPAQEVPRKTPHVLQRVIASLRSFGARQRARLARFLQKLVGK